MPGLDRSAQTRAVDDFVAAASVAPSALVIEGEAGIGKTTLWLSATAQAHDAGFRVLRARAAAAESVLAHASIADLLADVATDLWAGLPDPQQLALDRILLRTNDDGPASNQRALAAGFLSVVEAIAKQAPVLLAIDDLQWLDSSSQQVLAYAARRLKGRVGVLATVRSEPGAPSPVTWLQLPRPDDLQRIGLAPMTLGGLHMAISDRLGRSFSRPAMRRIQEVSGGNPFYALELARAIKDDVTAMVESLPGTLSELVHARIGRLRADVQQALLAAACVAAPTVELVARATESDAADTVVRLEEAEGSGIIAIEGHLLQFAHPLLARGVYVGAGAAGRRAMHRRLAAIVDELELQARHLALAATTADPKTLQSLDAAAEIARLRGAPASAAELLDLAIGLGGDTPLRRIRAASNHLNAGDTARARGMLEETIKTIETIEPKAPGVVRAEALNLLAVVRLYDDSLLRAAALLKRALTAAEDHLELRVQILLTLSFVLFSIDDEAAAQTIEDTVTEAERLGSPHLLSQALSRRAILHFFRGDGVDEADLRRACALEDHEVDTPVAFRPSMHNAMLLGWTGKLEQAREEIASIRRRCIGRGDENHLIFVALHGVRIDIWRGDFAAAAQATEEAMECARQLGGDIPRFSALTMRCAVACYAGRVDGARADGGEALEVARRSGNARTAQWTTAALGFLDVSLGRYEPALLTLEPLLVKLNANPDATEITFASFVPDAVEALIALGRLAEADALIEQLERNGHRLDRAWMLAVGARGRAMLQAAQGDLAAAGLTAARAMAQHDRLPMPFERARTQLLVGQIQRRQRQKESAAVTLGQALAAFEDLKTPLWAERARMERARVNVGAGDGAALTPTEQRVAELAAAGMINRDIAATLFISPKTVEANLARVYRKLGIRARAELGRRMDRS